MKRRVGDISPTQLLQTYGVGAMIDLPNVDAMVMDNLQTPIRGGWLREVVLTWGARAD